MSQLMSEQAFAGLDIYHDCMYACPLAKIPLPVLKKSFCTIEDESQFASMHSPYDSLVCTIEDESQFGSM
jgi:hypothetical protein